MKKQLTLFASEEVTETGQTGAIDVSDIDEMSVFLNVSAGSGTNPTLDVVIEDSPDGVKWHTKESFTQATGITTEAKRITNFGKFIRVKRTIGGTDTPTFTFDVKATGRIIK